MAGTVLRNGPADGRRMNPRMDRLEIGSCAAIRPSSSRTARSTVPAPGWFSDSLSQETGGVEGIDEVLLAGHQFLIEFVGLRVLGIPISGNVDPNTTIVLPGIGFIILNEQFCDNGAAATHSCSGVGHSGITVRSARVVVTVANNLLKLDPGVELILSEAHADTTYSGLS